MYKRQVTYITHINLYVLLFANAFDYSGELYVGNGTEVLRGVLSSSASGMLAGINMAHVLKGEEPVVLGVNTMMGAMAHYITHADPSHFQPMNANFGIMHLEGEVKKKDRKAAYAPQALKIIQELKEKNGF